MLQTTVWLGIAVVVLAYSADYSSPMWWRELFLYTSAAISIGGIFLFRQYEDWPMVLRVLGIMSLAIIVLGLVRGNPAQSLLGYPTGHPGALAIAASIMIALFLVDSTNWKLGNIFVFTAGYTLLSMFTFSGGRLMGLVTQANVSALISAIGYIVGLRLFILWPKYRWQILVLEIVLLAGVILTQSRLVILAIIIATVISVFLSAREEKSAKAKTNILLLVIGVLVLIVIMVFFVPRFVNFQYLIESIHYRLDLWLYSLRMLVHAQPLGLGSGSIALHLIDFGQPPPRMMSTIANNYYFESSHNILIDRGIEWGLLGLATYLTIIIASLRSVLANWSKNLIEINIIVLMIIVFVLINNSVIELEMIFWLFLIRLIYPKPFY